MKEIIDFARKGYVTSANFSIVKKVKFVLKLFLVLTISSFLIIVMMQLINHHIIELPRPDKLSKLNDLSTLEIFFRGVVFAPIIEELIFRLCLKFTKLNFSVMISSMVFLMLNMFFELSKTHVGLFSLLLGIILYLIIADRVLLILNNFWMQNRVLILYCLLLSFSYLHLANYDSITLKLILLSPIILLTKFVGGFIMSYARLKIGIISSIVLHVLNNSIAFVFLVYHRFL